LIEGGAMQTEPRSDTWDEQERKISTGREKSSSNVSDANVL